MYESVFTVSFIENIYANFKNQQGLLRYGFTPFLTMHLP
jgi:hypothetical protein